MRFYFKNKETVYPLINTTLKDNLLEGYCSVEELVVSHFTLFVENDNKVQEIKYELVSFENHCITLKVSLNGILNRREAYRLPCNINGTLRIGGQYHNVNITNLSIKGLMCNTPDVLEDRVAYITIPLENCSVGVVAECVGHHTSNNLISYRYQFVSLELTTESRISQYINQKQLCRWKTSV